MKRDSLIPAVGGIAATGGITMVTAGGGGVTAGIAVFLAMLPGAISLALQCALTLRLGQAKTWWETFVKHSPGRTEAELKGLLEANANKPYVHETIPESIRVLLDTVSPDVVPAMGAIAAQYIADEKTPDAFFRGTVRVLKELGTKEFEDLKRIVKKAADTGPPERTLWLTYFKREKVTCAVPLVSGQFEEFDCPNVERLFFLLKSNGLGKEPLGFTTAGAGDGNWSVAKAVVVDLHKIIE